MIPALAGGLIIWACVSPLAAIAVGKLLAALGACDPVPDADDDEDWLLDQPCDCWSQVRVDAEFAALIAAEDLA